MLRAFELVSVITAIVLLIPSSVKCGCQPKTYIATDSSWNDIEHTDYSSNEDCSFEIKPDYNRNKYFDYSKYLENWRKYIGYGQQFDYFLEISWKSFNVRGNMPNCNNDYVEIFLTKSEKSIGRFCSDNLVSSSLFTMYSYDGYAKVKFHSDGAINGKGFKLSFRLRRTSSNYLQYFGGTTDECNKNLFSAVNNFYSPRWPHEYERMRNSPCMVKIDSVGVKKIILMDLDLKRYTGCKANLDDNIQIRGTTSASKGFQFATVIKGPICRTSSVVSVTTSNRYVYIRFTRTIGSTSERGFVAGYVTYNDESQDESKAKSSLISATNWLVIIISTTSSLCFVAIVIGIGCCCCYRKKKAMNTQSSAFNTAQSVTYSSFQPSVGFQGPYQATHTYPSDMPPAYSAYDKACQRAPTPNDDEQYRSPPAYNPAYEHPPQQLVDNRPMYY